MANKVEIIIQAVDKYSKELKKAGIDLRSIARAGAAIAGGFALAYRALESFGKTARELNFKKTADQVDYMARSLKDVEAALLQFNLGGMQIQGWLGQAAQGFGDLIRLIGVGLAGALNFVNFRFIELRYNMAQVLPGLVEYTRAQKDADIAASQLAFETNVGRIAMDGYAASLENVNKKLAATGVRNVKLKNSVTDLWEANKKLRDSYDEIEEAIRAGDARALARAMSGSAGGGGGLRTGLSGPRANVANGADRGGSVKKGEGVLVQVYLSNKPVEDLVERVVINGISGGKKGGGPGRRGSSRTSSGSSSLSGGGR